MNDVILELVPVEGADSNVNISKVDAEGIVTSVTPIGTAEPGTPIEKAAALAAEYGWAAEGEWDTAEDTKTQWVFVKAAPVTVTFIGSVTDENAMTLAKSRGVPATGVQGRSEPTDGRTRITMSVDEPRGWAWDIDETGAV